MNPSVWGPGTWELIHATSLNLPISPSEKTKNNYKLFYENLQYTLPCETCRLHYINIFKSNPIDEYLISSNHLFYWTWKIHNLVNQNTNNTIMNYDLAIRKYNRLYGINIKKVIQEEDTVSNYHNTNNIYFTQYRKNVYGHRRYG